MLRILIYGDSNTYGTAPMVAPGQPAVHPRGVRWGDVMADELGEGFEVVIEGLPGRTSVLDDPVEGAYRNGLTVLPAIIFSHSPIDLLMICLGTNDQKFRFGLGGQDIAFGLARLAHEAMATGVVGRVMLIAPPLAKERGAFAPMFAGAEARAANLPSELRRVARVEGAVYFDAGQVIDVDDMDGIHWSAASHAALGAALAGEVRALF